MKEDKEIVFSITIEDLQQEALKRVGKRLTEEEIHTASKGVEAGLIFDIDTVFNTAIDEAVISE